MHIAVNFKDYYAILDIEKTASEDDIKAAYRTLALQWHPDRHSKEKEEAGRKFIEINEAYRFLMDKGRREWYDNFPATGRKDRGRSNGEEKPSAGGGLDDSTSNLPRAKSESGVRTGAPDFTSPPQDKPRARAKSADDRDKKEPQTDFQDFVHRVPTGKGERADGRGRSSKRRKPTVYDFSGDEASVETVGKRLHTTTVVTTSVPSEWIFPLPLTLEELSQGTTHRYRITRHLLSGKKKNVVVDIDIAPGWKKGTKIRFAGAGNERQGLPPQDVVFVVDEVPHERFVREGSALVTRVPISLLEALTGDGRAIILQGLDGKDIEVRVPPGVIKPGDEYRIVGAGMPIRKQGKMIGQGDMFIRWEILFPYKLSKKDARNLRKTLNN